jgi:[acyl-carrier-protein] S-malonyltransferase
VAPLALPIVANVTAEAYQDPARVKELLFAQVTGSVRWEESMQRLLALGVDEAFEVGPGMVLAKLCKRIAPAIKMGALDG